MLSRKIRDNWGLIVSFIIGLGPIFLFWNKMPVGEEYYALDYAKWGELISESWVAFYNYGSSDFTLPFKLQGWFFIFLRTIGLSRYFALLTWHIVMWTVGSCAFYLLAKKVYKNKVSDAAALISTFYYVYTPFYLNISIMLSPPRIVLTLLPVILYLLLLYSENPRSQLKYLFYLNLVVLLGSPAFVNIPASTALLLPVFLFITYQNLLVHLNLKKQFGHALFFLATFFILQSWWLIPFSQATFMTAKAVQKATSAFNATRATRVSDTLSFFGSWALREPINDEYNYNVYFKAYDTFPLVLVRYVPYLLITFGLFAFLKAHKQQGEKNDFYIFSALLFFFAIFFSKGGVGLGSQIFNWLFKHFPGFWMYREPYAKFMPLAVISGSLLLVYGIESFANFSKLPLVLRKYVKLLILICILSIAYPFINGDATKSPNDGCIRGVITEVPDYWWKFLKEWRPVGVGYYLEYPSRGMTDALVWPQGHNGAPYTLLQGVHAIRQFTPFNKSTYFIASYLYKNLLENPTRFIAEAPRFFISGVINQGDTCLVGSDIKDEEFFSTNYGNYSSYRQPKINIYEFAKQDAPFDVISKSQLISTDEDTIGYYSLLREFLPIDTYLKLNKEAGALGEEIFAPKRLPTDPDGDDDDDKPENKARVMRWDLSRVPAGAYRIIFTAPVPSEPQVETDVGAVGELLAIDANCCKNLDLVLRKNRNLVAESAWLPISAGDKFGMRLSKELKGFEPKLPYHLALKRDVADSSVLIVDFIARNSRTGQMGVFWEIQQKAEDRLDKTYTPAPEVLAGLLDGYDSFYIGIKTASKDGVVNVNITDESSVSIEVFEWYLPSVLLIPAQTRDVPSTTKPEITFERRGSSLYLLDISGSFDGVLLFKNAFDPNWRLIKLPPSNFDAKNLLALFLKSIRASDDVGGLDGAAAPDEFNAVQPMNIEAYMNGWELKQEGNARYAVVFWPTLLHKLLIQATLLLLALVALGFLAVRLKRKATLK